MDYSGPQAADFANVRALNLAFLSILRRSGGGVDLRQHLPGDLQTVVVELNDLQIQRLAEAPFLLMSFREDDSDLWHSLVADEPCHDLFLPQQATDETMQLTTAGLGFLWQLAQRNPYAVRLISGATLDWCGLLADTTLLQLLQNATGDRDLLALRHNGERVLWSKLLGAGISRRPDIRTAAQLSALQSLLTTAPASRYRQVRAAACAAPIPVLRKTEKLRRS